MSVEGKPRFPVLSRRGFFKSMMGEVVSAVEEYRGTPQFRLSDLWELPDEMVARIKPVTVARVDIVIDGGHVWGIMVDQKKRVSLFEAKEENLFVFERMNKDLTIGEIGKNLSNAMHWDEAEAFLFVKRLFLSLVESRVCVPGNKVG